MRGIGADLQLSASDLSNHIACRHSTFLDLCAANGFVKPPDYSDPKLEILIERGMEFERAYLDHLKTQGLSIDEPESENHVRQRTITAMQNGIEVIYQAELSGGVWFGRADILIKVNKPSNLGHWSYEVIDTKLAKHTKAGTVLQICLYSRMLSRIQGVMPDFMHVVTPENGFNKESYIVNHYLAYLAFVERRLQTAIANGPNIEMTYPLPVPHCDICRWWKSCDDRRRADDHLSLVAGLSNLNNAQISQWEIKSLETFATIPSPIQFKVLRGSIETYERLRHQAYVQLLSRRKGTPYYEELEPIDGKGLHKLPEPSKGDVFFDFEGDPFAGNNGLEYLFGWVTEDEGETRYHCLWAFSPAEEKKALEEFIDVMMQRWNRFPDMHVYHYTSYEPATLKRLMGRYATRENEIDSMLRAGFFIDLHSVVKNAIRAGVESYSLKQLEAFHDFKRQLELRDASSSLLKLEISIERKLLDKIPEEIKADVETYNREDCLSTRSLRTWLEKILATINQTKFPPITRPPILLGEASENITQHQERIQPLINKLMAGISVDPTERNPSDQAKWILANMLDWYRREQKSVWWEFYRLQELTQEELMEERSAISHLSFSGNRKVVKNGVIDIYTFQPQEFDIRDGDDICNINGEGLGSIVYINASDNLVAIEKGRGKVDIHPSAVFKFSIINPGAKEESIYRIAEWVVENGIDANGHYRAGRDLLLRNNPRLLNEIRNQTSAIEWMNALDNGLLSIQGPPGTGKSYTAAQIVIDAVKKGKKVGITALGHKVIRSLLEKILEMAKTEKVLVKCVQKVKEKPLIPTEGIVETTGYPRVMNLLKSGECQVAAGTSWLWAREEFAESVDLLIVDEAGQLALIDTVAVSQASKKLILLGDPQQLKQPQQGTHPDGTEVSALEHVLNGHETIESEKGIFLPETRRMHPWITQFISEQFYEGRLQSYPNTANQKLDGNTKYQPAGLWFEAVQHQGNQNMSIEEVSRITEIVQELTKGDVFWTDAYGKRRVLGVTDILIIAPYNAQVFALSRAIPDGRIGTVDKFQGLEAPVVIYSITTSTPQDAPRGMEFLYSSNRLNVAVSRAKAVCILVGNPLVFEPDCKTPAQMRLANAFCRYLELCNSDRSSGN